MRPITIIDKNDPQCLDKFKALAQGTDWFVVTNVDQKNDYTYWGVKADDLGWKVLVAKEDLNSFYFVRKQERSKPARPDMTRFIFSGSPED